MLFRSDRNIHARGVLEVNRGSGYASTILTSDSGALSPFGFTDGLTHQDVSAIAFRMLRDSCAKNTELYDAKRSPVARFPSFQSVSGRTAIAPLVLSLAVAILNVPRCLAQDSTDWQVKAGGATSAPHAFGRPER